MKAKYLLIVPLVSLIALKILFSIISFLFSRNVLLALLGFGIAFKTGLLSKVRQFFKPKNTKKNSEVVIEVETTKLD